MSDDKKKKENKGRQPRTTVAIRKEYHRKLRLIAVLKDKSIGELLEEMIEEEAKK